MLKKMSEVKETPVPGSPTIIPLTPDHLRSQRGRLGPFSPVKVVPETPPKKVTPPAPKRYRYERHNGWIHCRVPVKPDGFGSSKRTVSFSRKKLSFDKEFEKSLKPKKDKRYTCPDCEAWYEGDSKRIQYSSRHRQRFETEEELRAWDISFPDSDSD